MGRSLSAHVYALTPPPDHIQPLQALDRLEQAGFIGQYWHFYYLCAANPAQHKCTPYYQGDGRRGRWREVRCSRFVEEVLQSPSLTWSKPTGWRSFP
jgi:hypothetical protein